MSREDLLRELGGAVRDYQRAVDEMDEAASELFGVNRTDLRALDVLEAESPLPAGELARRLNLSAGAVTTLVDRLERAGYARRVRSERDRRRVDVELTRRAHDLTALLYGPIAESGMVALQRYRDDELRLVIEFMRLGAEVNREGAVRARKLERPSG